MASTPERTLALLGGGAEQCAAVRAARELGFATLVVDDDPDAPARLLADRFLASRIKDVERLHRDLGALEFQGVFTHAAELGVELAQVAERFGLPALSVEAARRGTLKHLRIRALQAAGVPVPDHRILCAEDDRIRWRAAALELGYPLVAKPVNEKGALGVRLVRDPDELDAYHAARLPSSPWFVLEAFERGLEISTESVLLDGRAAWHSFALRHYEGMERYHPFLIEDGHSMELELPRDLEERIEECIAAAAQAIGVHDGVLKGDVLVRADGTPVVLEMAIRTSGGRFADLVTPLHCGVNILHPLIQLAMGEPVDRSLLEPRWRRGVSQRYLFLPEGARARRLPRVTDFTSREGTVEVVLAPHFLRTLTQPRVTSHHDRIGYVVCTGPDRASADARARDLVRELLEEMQ